MNEGWVCPRCQKVHAPNVKGCDCKSDEELKSNEDLEELRKYLDLPKDPPKWPEHPNQRYSKPYYFDWTYRPYQYWYHTPKGYLVYTTTSGDTVEK